MSRPRCALLLAAATACGGGGDGDGPDAAAPEPDARTCSGADVRTEPQIYYGTTMPTYAPLTPGQILAIGAWTSNGPGDIFCSGTLIAPSWVLTAAHCEVAVGNTFCFGATAQAGVCLAAAEVHTRPSVTIDRTPTALALSVVRLAAAASSVVPGIEPVPILVESGFSGSRYFTGGYSTGGHRHFT